MAAISLRTDQKNKQFILIYSTLFLGLWGGLYLFGGALFPFILGFFLAYVLNPLVDMTRRIGLSRGVASVLVVVATVVGIIQIVLIAWPLMVAQISTIVAEDPARFAHLPLVEYLTAIKIGGRSIWAWVQMGVGSISGHLGQYVQLLMSSSSIWLERASGLTTLIGTLLLSPIITYYILKDWPKMMAWAQRQIPVKHQKDIVAEAVQIHHTLGAYVRGQTLVVLIFGVYYTITLWSIGYGPHAIWLGIVSGLSLLVPVVGIVVAALLTVVLGIFKLTTVSQLLSVVAAYGLGSILEGYVITPRLVGERLGLQPIWILFALVVGGKWFGWMGLVFALPVAAIFKGFVALILGHYRGSRLYNG